MGGSPRTWRTQLIEATKALGSNQRELAGTIRELRTTVGEHGRRLESVESKVDDTNQMVRSLEESNAEIKDLLVRALDR